MTLIKGYNTLIKKISHINRGTKDYDYLTKEQKEIGKEKNNEVRAILKKGYSEIKENLDTHNELCSKNT